MTSNIGAEQVIKGGGLGFGTGDSLQAFEKIRDRLFDMAKKKFKPEFINRLDEVIVFRRLERKDLLGIVNIETGKVKERLKAQDLELNIDRDVFDFLIDKGYQPEYGARPLRRAIEKFLEDALAEELLKGYFKNSKNIRVMMDKENLVFVPDTENEIIDHLKKNQTSEKGAKVRSTKKRSTKKSSSTKQKKK
jgi:ATP-dependent Clp protease ATP-binding subunit ClpC